MLWDWLRKVIEPHAGAERSYSDLGGVQPDLGDGAGPGGPPQVKRAGSSVRKSCSPASVLGPEVTSDGVHSETTASGSSSGGSNNSGDTVFKPSREPMAAAIAPVAAQPAGSSYAPRAAPPPLASSVSAPALTPPLANSRPSLGSGGESAASLAAEERDRARLRYECRSFVLGGVQFDVDARYEMKAVVGKGAYGVVASADVLVGRREAAADAVQGAGTSAASVACAGAYGCQSVAVKKIFDPFQDRTDCKRLLREVRLLRVLRHPNVLRLLDMLPPATLRPSAWKDVYLITKLYDTNLHRVIYSGQPLSDEHIQYILWQALCALRYLHRAGVVHRDLKPTNILLNRDCELALADLGLARYIGRTDGGAGAARHSEEVVDPGLGAGTAEGGRASDADEITGRCETAGAVGSGAGLSSLTKYVVTRWYRAPELLVQNQRYDAAVDMWSLGCILGELLGARALFPGKDSLHQLKLLVERLGAPSPDELALIENAQAVRYVASLRSRQAPAQHGRAAFGALFPAASPLLLDLVAQLLRFDPAKRPTAEEALGHPYLAAYRDAPEEDAPIPEIEMDFEGRGASKEELRHLVWREMCKVRLPDEEGRREQSPGGSG